MGLLHKKELKVASFNHRQIRQKPQLVRNPGKRQFPGYAGIIVVLCILLTSEYGII